MYEQCRRDPQCPVDRSIPIIFGDEVLAVVFVRNYASQPFLLSAFPEVSETFREDRGIARIPEWRA